MAPSHLQGLNIVHAAPSTPSYLSDADLLSLPPFPDLHAQLDLWTNLNFQSDEPPGVPLNDNAKNVGAKNKGRSPAELSEDDLDRYEHDGGIAEAGAHENVVTGTVLPPTGVAHSGHPTATPSPSVSGPLDINSLLAGIGIDPFLAPQAAQAPNANTLAQLLSLHAASFMSPQINSSQSVPPTPSPVVQTSQLQQSPAQKRARTTRPATDHSPSAESPDAEEKESATPLTAAEDKRRRNTAASARFRLKKKEREAALERKAKELEVRVSELEKECEALRRENGWLKGLVVGVTGVSAVQQQVGPAPVSVGTKRSREDGEVVKEDST